MSKKNDPARTALLKAAEAARKVMRRHGYDLPEEAIVQSYVSETGTEEANAKVLSAQKLGGQARASRLICHTTTAPGSHPTTKTCRNAFALL